MAVSLGNQSSVTGTGSLTPAWPTSIATNDLVVAVAVGIQWATVPTLGGMSGWTLLAYDTRGMGSPNPRNYFGAVWAKTQPYVSGDTAPTLTQTGGTGTFPPASRLTLFNLHPDRPYVCKSDSDTVAIVGSGSFTATSPSAETGQLYIMCGTSASTSNIGSNWSTPPTGWSPAYAVDRTWFTYREDTGAGMTLNATSSNWLVNISAWGSTSWVPRVTVV